MSAPHAITPAMPRPTCCVFIATSLDGYIAGPGGSLDFLKTVERAGEDYGYADFFKTIDTLIVGRTTYETVLGFGAWPYTDKQCAVLTHRPAPSKHGERFLSGTPEEVLAQLPTARRIYVDGGDVIRQFLAAGLIDELTLSTIPVLLGGGAPLFGAAPKRNFTLKTTRGFPSGLVQATYRAT